MVESDDLVRQSLFVHVVMLYSRAPHSQDSGRPFKGGVLKGYATTLRAAQERVIHIRDKVLAHHAAAADQDWTDDRLVLALLEGVFNYRFVFERKLLTREALQDLRALLPAAFEQVRARALNVERKMHDTLESLIHTDARVRDAVAASRFDPAAYFGPGPLAEAFEAGGDPGDYAGHIRWTREAGPEDAAF